MKTSIRDGTIVITPLNWLHTNDVQRLFAKSDAAVHTNFTPSDLSDIDPKDPPYYIGIFVGSTLIGVATLGYDNEADGNDGTTGLLSDVYVTFAARGKGYGTILVETILEIVAPEQGYQHVTISVLNPALLEWYSRMGFKSTSEWTATYTCANI